MNFRVIVDCLQIQWNWGWTLGILAHIVQEWLFGSRRAFWKTSGTVSIVAWNFEAGNSGSSRSKTSTSDWKWQIHANSQIPLWTLGPGKCMKALLKWLRWRMQKRRHVKLWMRPPIWPPMLMSSQSCLRWLSDSAVAKIQDINQYPNVQTTFPKKVVNITTFSWPVKIMKIKNVDFSKIGKLSTNSTIAPMHTIFARSWLICMQPVLIIYSFATSWSLPHWAWVDGYAGSEVLEEHVVISTQ